MKRRKLLRAVSVLILHSFLFCEVNFAAVLTCLEANDVSCLSPVIKIESIGFKQSFEVISLRVISGSAEKIEYGKNTSHRAWLESYTTPEQRYVMALGASLYTPMRLEIHPYHQSQTLACNNNCIWCTRARDKFDLARSKTPGVRPDSLMEFIETLKKSGVQDVVISGNSTEPLLYPWIEDLILKIKEIGLPFRLFSNFYYGAKIVQIADIFEAGDVVRISLDAGSQVGYNLTHRPRDKKAFGKILRNIEDLLSRRRELRSNFQVHMTYLLSKNNSSLEDIRFIVEWARDNGVNSIRFALPLKPEISNPGYDERFFLSDSQIKEILDFLSAMKKGNPEYASSIAILNDSQLQPDKEFKECHHWKMIAVLGASGMFFPCTSTSMVEGMRELGRGPLGAPEFDFNEFWSNKNGWKKIDPKECLKGKCVDCTRWEFVVNREIDQLRISLETINQNASELIGASI